jgi:RND family efflux transporter MFP subunit
VGSKAEVTVPGIDEPIEATVSLISPALDPGSTTVEVWLKLANADGKLRVGTAVHAVIQGRKVANALQIPVTALLPAQDGSNTVMVVGTDNVAHLKPVTVGIRTDKTVQILSGISARDTVITNGSYGLDDGTKVRIGAAGGDEDDKPKAKPDAGEKD